MGQGAAKRAADTLGTSSVWKRLRELEAVAGASGIKGDEDAKVEHLFWQLPRQMSRRHARRCFKKKTGQSMREHILQTRINCSKFMLNETELPIKQIAFALGYPSPSKFIEQFHRAVGLTPGRFRNACVLGVIQLGEHSLSAVTRPGEERKASEELVVETDVGCGLGGSARDFAE